MRLPHPEDVGIGLDHLDDENTNRVRHEVDGERPLDESGWLVERAAERGYFYWTGTGWSPDSLDALRFAREADATKFITVEQLSSPHTFAAEHVWCAS